MWQVQHGGAVFVCKRYLAKLMKSSLIFSDSGFDPDFLSDVCGRKGNEK